MADPLPFQVDGIPLLRRPLADGRPPGPTGSSARNLKLCCVVEGIETAEQARLLESLGCVQMQGYQSPPLSGGRHSPAQATAC
jgi:hypothetical protein